MQAYDGIIFDLDGTLWDATPQSAKGLQCALASLGHDHHISAQHIRQVSGKPFDVCNQEVLGQVGAAVDPTIVLPLWDEHEQTCIKAEGGVIYPDVMVSLEQLNKHYPLFLISNCQDWYLDCFWEKSGAQHFFTDWNCHGKSGHTKSRMIKQMKSKHQLSRLAYIGDTLGDREACSTAGVDFIFAAYGFGQVDDCTLAISNLVELTQKLIRSVSV